MPRWTLPHPIDVESMVNCYFPPHTHPVKGHIMSTELTATEKEQLANISDLLFESAINLLAAGKAIHDGPVPALNVLLDGAMEALALAGHMVDSVLGGAGSDKVAARSERINAIDPDKANAQA